MIIKFIKVYYHWIILLHFYFKLVIFPAAKCLMSLYKYFHYGKK